MGHVDMFWVYFILYFAYIVSDEDCHVVYDLVRKLCELEDGGGLRGFYPSWHGHFLLGYLPFLGYTTSSIWAYSHLQKGSDMEQPDREITPCQLSIVLPQSVVKNNGCGKRHLVVNRD